MDLHKIVILLLKTASFLPNTCCEHTTLYRLMKLQKNIQQRRWFSGKIHRCHRWAPGSIPGRRKIILTRFATFTFLIVRESIDYFTLEMLLIGFYFVSKAKMPGL